MPANCVDVVTAKALRDDIFRRRALTTKWCQETITVAEDKEAAEITERIAACEVALQCPPGYNEGHYKKDDLILEIDRKREFNRKYMNGAGLSEADDGYSKLLTVVVSNYRNVSRRRTSVQPSMTQSRRALGTASPFVRRQLGPGCVRYRSSSAVPVACAEGHFRTHAPQ